MVDRVKAITGRIDLVHLNDSRDAFGSGADRHANIGHGHDRPGAARRGVRRGRRAGRGRDPGRRARPPTSRSCASGSVLAVTPTGRPPNRQRTSTATAPRARRRRRAGAGRRRPRGDRAAHRPHAARGVREQGPLRRPGLRRAGPQHAGLHIRPTATSATPTSRTCGWAATSTSTSSPTSRRRSRPRAELRGGSGGVPGAVRAADVGGGGASRSNGRGVPASVPRC